MAQIIFPGYDISLATDILNGGSDDFKILKEIYKGNVEWIPNPESFKNRIKENMNKYLRVDFWDYSERAKQIQEYSVSPADIVPYYIADAFTKHGVWRMHIIGIWGAMNEAKEKIFKDFEKAALLRSAISLKDSDPVFGYLYAHLIAISLLPLPEGEKSIKHHTFPYLVRAYGVDIASVQNSLEKIYDLCKDILDSSEYLDLKESAQELSNRVLLNLAQRKPNSVWATRAKTAGL